MASRGSLFEDTLEIGLGGAGEHTQTQLLRPCPERNV